MSAVRVSRYHHPMALSDDDLLDFDHSRLADFELDRARRTLAEKGDVFRAQLVAARWIDGWRERVLESPPMGDNEDFRAGWDSALREVIAHLRQGDFVPGGVLYDEEMGGRLSR